MKKVKLAIFGLLLVAVTSCKKAENNSQTQPRVLTVSTYAGSGSPGYFDSNATAAMFYGPKGIALDPSGNLYITDNFNHRIRKVSTEGVVTTFAGSEMGYADGVGTAAKFTYPVGIVADASGNLYVTDSGNARIRKITPAGVVSTYAGSGVDGFEDGDALNAQFLGLQYITIDASNNLYVADMINNRIRKISASGKVTTVAGNGEYNTVDGPVSTASIAEPVGITIDPSGNLYVSQNGEYGYIRKITTDGQVIKITGTNLPIAYLDGIAGVARIGDIGNLRSDADGNIYIVDAGNSLIRKYNPKTNMISTYAGLFNYVRVSNYERQRNAIFKDGPADQALFNYPIDCIFNSKGEMYIADHANHIIRKISPTDPPADQSDLEKKNWNKPANWK